MERSRPLRYLDQVVAASGQLVNNRNEPIVLPESMKNVQDELNLFREQAIRNEAMAKEAEQRKNDLIVYWEPLEPRGFMGSLWESY